MTIITEMLLGFVAVLFTAALAWGVGAIICRVWGHGDAPALFKGFVGMFVGFVGFALWFIGHMLLKL